MIVNFKISNFGPFQERACLNFVASKDQHLNSSYVRELKLNNGKSIRLLRMAMIYGANASGKTTILQALSLLDELVTSPAKARSEGLQVNTFAFQSPPPNTELSVSFVRSGELYRYTLLLHNAGILCETLEIKKIRTFATIYQICRQTISDEFNYSFSKEHELNVSERETLQTKLLPNTTALAIFGDQMTIRNNHITQAYRWFSTQLMGEVNTKTSLTPWITRLLDEGDLKKKRLMYFLRQAGITVQNIKLRDRELEPFEQELLDRLSRSGKEDEQKILLEMLQRNKSVYTQYQVEDETFELSLERQESLGTQRYFGLAGLLSLLCADAKADASNEQSKHCKILPIDEIEHSLHPELLKHFLLHFLKDSGYSQLIATTHYREMLSDEMIYRKDVIWFTDKNPQHLSSTLYNLKDVQTQAGLRASSSVYNFYAQGRLGAVPIFGKDQDDELFDHGNER